MSAQHWHFARPDFAEKVFNLLVSGAVPAITLFGPRRTGKTEFLLRDLGPLADRQGHRVVYASLWQSPVSPLATLIYELEEARRIPSFQARFDGGLRQMSVKLTLRDPFTGSKVAVDLSTLKDASSEMLLVLDQLLGQVASRSHPTFLLLDEFQEVANGPGGADLVAALRTSLDKRKGALVSVFTGSSLYRLQAVFNRRTAPFFRFAQNIALPDLDDGFVDHMLTAARRSNLGPIDRAEALEAFEAFQKNPEFFRKWLRERVFNPASDKEALLKQVETDLAAEFEFDHLWLGLTPLQRATARMIAEKVPQPTGRNGLDFVEALTGDRPPNTTRLQTARDTLASRSILDKIDGMWSISDPVLEDWIRARPRSDF
ncbi:MAG: ATP-binding protein [Rhodobacteraceae bacterium]|nr:ATP-binding protein [Paracoccaceae bacterium]